MEPVCVSAWLSLLQCFVFLMLFLTFGTKPIDSLPVYDRLTLLNIRQNAGDLGAFDFSGQKTLPPLLAEIPVHLHRVPAPALR